MSKKNQFSWRNKLPQRSNIFLKNQSDLGLSSLPPGYFCMLFFLSSADFFQNQLFQKILSVIPSECQTDWIQIRPDILSGLIWLQTVCKSYQQTTLQFSSIKGKYGMSLPSSCASLSSPFVNSRSKLLKDISPSSSTGSLTRHLDCLSIPLRVPFLLAESMASQTAVLSNFFTCLQIHFSFLSSSSSADCMFLEVPESNIPLSVKNNIR